MMLPLRSLGFLGLSPILQCSACRYAPLFSQQDLRPQCFLANSFPDRPSATASTSRPYSTANAQHGFSYRMGASFSAKGRRFNPKTDYYYYDPTEQRSKRETGRPISGQDAFFISKIGNGTNVTFGVADGVGGWSDSGIDSAHFSHGLCERMIETAVNTDEKTEKAFGAQKLLQKAYDAVVADETIVGGGSTACIAVGRADGHLDVANLGDSGFVQLRLNAVHHYSNPQTHAFNTPYQLSIIPPKVLARAKIFGGSPLSDYPRDASVTSHQLRHGDILVFATDGVWDNLSATDVLHIVSRHMTGFQAWAVGDKGMSVADAIHNVTKSGGIPKEHEDNLQTLLAITITGEAKMASVNAKRDGPFAKEVQRWYPNEEFHGGKVDDICVVVAIVVKE